MTINTIIIKNLEIIVDFLSRFEIEGVGIEIIVEILQGYRVLDSNIDHLALLGQMTLGIIAIIDELQFGETIVVFDISFEIVALAIG